MIRRQKRSDVTPQPKQPRPARQPRALRSVSPKRENERPARDALRQAALERADWRCQAKYLVPEIDCAFYGDRGLEVDEVIPRNGWISGHLELDNVQVLCPAHHDWKTANPRAAHKRGLRKWSHERGTG